MTGDDGDAEEVRRDPARLLVVCTANICRSPMAESLFQEYVLRHAPHTPLVISSAGTMARPGQRAATGMQEVAASWGLSLADHRSRRIDAEMALQQDLIVTMEDAHRSAVARLAPGLASRTFLLTELAALREVSPDTVAAAGLPAAVASWHAQRARTALDVRDVEDPYGGPADGYTDTAWELAELVEATGGWIRAALSGS